MCRPRPPSPPSHLFSELGSLSLLSPIIPPPSMWIEGGGGMLAMTLGVKE